MTPVAADNAAAGRLSVLVTKTVEADRVISSESGGDWCNVLVFYEFDDHPGTVDAALTYEHGGEPKFASSSPPFHDVVDEPAYPPMRVAPAGRHRIWVWGSGVRDTDDPSQCEDEVVPIHKRSYALTGSVELAIEQEDEPKLTIELETYAAEGGNAGFTTFPPSAGVAPADADETTVLGVTVRNEGDEPLEGVQVRGLTTKVIESRCKGNPLTPGRFGPLGSPTTLQPGQERLEFYKFEEKCPGEVKATVRATAAGAEEETADIRIVVPDSAYIVGQLTVAPTLDGTLDLSEYQRLAENLRIRAVGEKKTLTGSIDEDRRFSIKVPNRALGRYRLSVTGNKVTEAIPVRNDVKAVRGKSVEAEGFELGYDCDEAPLGLEFVPDRMDYAVAPAGPGRPSRLIFSYECRTQRIQFWQLDLFNETPEPDAFEFDECESSDGSIYHAYHFVRPVESRLPLDRGEFEFSIPLETTASINEDVPASVEGVFTDPGGGTVTMTHPECDFLNFEADFN